MYMYECFCLLVCIRIAYVFGVYRGQKKALGPLELELKMVVSYDG